MFYSSEFSYKGISSETYNVFICQVGKSNIEGDVLNQVLNTEKIKGMKSTSLYGIERENLKFSITLTCNEWTAQKKDDILKWFCGDEEKYYPFISYDDLNVVYYCKPVSIDKTFFRFSQGYLNISFECNAPYGFTLPQTNTYNLTTISSPTTVTINNSSNIVKYYYPEIEITLNGTSISLKNKTINNEITSFTGLTSGETIYMNGEKQEILSSLSETTYRYSNHNGIFLRLAQQNNAIEVTGKCTLKIKTQYPILRI